MLKGRLGIETGRIPQADRHGVLWLGRGGLRVRDGTVCFVSRGGDLGESEYALPHQMLSCIVLEPGTSVTHDALRILARHGTGLVVAGEGGTRLYASMPTGPDSSARARRHARLWADPARRLQVVLQMYEERFGERFEDDDLDVLRGLEGIRMRKVYADAARDVGIRWAGRRLDRTRPDRADVANQALNHVSVAVVAAAQVATAVVGAVPQLGFIHENSGIAFPLDVADLYRTDLTIPVAFRAATTPGPGLLEQRARRAIRDEMRARNVVSTMIDKIKEILDDGNRAP